MSCLVARRAAWICLSRPAWVLGVRLRRHVVDARHIPLQVITERIVADQKQPEAVLLLPFTESYAKRSLKKWSAWTAWNAVA